MGRPAAKWPTYALDSLEKTLFELRQIESKTSQAQDAIVLGKTEEALRDLSDVRVMAFKCVENLVRARIGKYEQQEKTSQWNQSANAEDKAAEAVERVLATRRM